MRYIGSKRRLVKDIVPIIMSYYTGSETYIEPFVGGGNMIAEVPIEKRVGADTNRHAIEALKFIRDCPEQIPRNNSEYTKEMYLKARTLEDLRPVDNLALFQYSFGGQFNSVWARCKDGRDYVKEGLKNLLKQSKGLEEVELICRGYLDLDIPDNSIIYCDPPYNNSVQDGYKQGAFDSELFYMWCEKMAKRGHVVLVFEYSAPDHWEVLLKKELNNNLNNKKASEKLFKVEVGNHE